MTKSEKYKSMTEYLRLINSDDEVGDYIRWIIKSDSAKEYWAEIKDKEIEELKNRNAAQGNTIEQYQNCVAKYAHNSDVHSLDEFISSQKKRIEELENNSKDLIRKFSKEFNLSTEWRNSITEKFIENNF